MLDRYQWLCTINQTSIDLKKLDVQLVANQKPLPMGAVFRAHRVISFVIWLNVLDLYVHETFFFFLKKNLHHSSIIWVRIRRSLWAFSICGESKKPKTKNQKTANRKPNSGYCIHKRATYPSIKSKNLRIETSLCQWPHNSGGWAYSMSSLSFIQFDFYPSIVDARHFNHGPVFWLV